METTRRRTQIVARASFECIVVADEAIEPGDPVVKGAHYGIIRLCRPVEPITTTFTCRRGDRFDQPAARTAAPNGAVDEQILEIADFLRRPGMGVKEVVNDPRLVNTELASQWLRR